MNKLAKIAAKGGGDISYVASYEDTFGRESGIVDSPAAARARKPGANGRPAGGNGNNGAVGHIPSLSGGNVPTLMINPANLTGMNSVVQLSIDNSGVGNVALTLIIGSLLGEPGSFAQFGRLASACDNAVIIDQNGAGVLFTQGFSKMTQDNDVIIDKIKVSTANLQQRNQNITHNVIHVDQTVHPIQSNIAFTSEKTDDNATLAVALGQWTLTAIQWLEYPILAGAVVDFSMNVSAIANSASFTEVGYE